MKVTLLGVNGLEIGVFNCETEPVPGNIVVLPDGNALVVLRKYKNQMVAPSTETPTVRIYGEEIGKGVVRFEAVRR